MSESQVLKESTSDFAQMQKEAVQDAEYLELSLRFNESRAVYQVKNSDGFLSEKEDNVLLWCNCSNNYFTDLANKVVLYNSRQSSRGIVKKDEFLIEIPLATEWVLSNESKVIQDLKCHKATQSISHTNNRGKVVTKEIVAWFAPEIPYSFGPNGYGGLPGMIVELQEGDTLFGLKSLKLTGTPAINLPTTGKKVTKEEYDVTLKERVTKAMQSTGGGR